MLDRLILTLDFNNFLGYLIASFAYLAAAFILFLLGKFVYQLIHKDADIDDEMVNKDNLAFAWAHVGYYAGLVVAIGGVISGDSNGLVNDLIAIFAYGLVAIVLLNLTILINDKLILSKFKVRKEILEDRNIGTGVVEGASALASGLIIYGALTIDGQSHFDAFAVWVIGQIFLIVTAKVYNAITPYDIHEHIEKDNIAVGVGFAGALVAVANLIRFGISQEFTTLSETVIIMLVDTGLGLLLLPVVRILTDKLLLPKRKMVDEIIHQEKPNIGVALIEAFAYVGGSMIITWCL